MSRIFWVAFAVLVSVGWPVVSVQAAPSFRCDGKLSVVEKAICADPKLGDADVQLAKRYRATLNAASAEAKPVVASAQRAWLKARNQACSSEPMNACLLHQYQQRLAQLSATSEPVAGDTAYSAYLKPGEQVFFNSVLLSCKADAVQVDVIDSTLPMSVLAKTLEGRGLTGSAWADCALGSGQVVRVKAGYGSVPQGYGACGGTPESRLSVWVNRRKAVQGLEYAQRCGDSLVKSMTIHPGAADYCFVAAAEATAVAEAPGELSANGCKRISFKAEAPVDGEEFPAAKDGPALVVGSLKLVSSKAEVKALCEGIVALNTAYPLVAPKGIEQPVWSKVADLPKVDGEQPWTAAGDVFRAQFDMDNSGQVGTVYRQEQQSHAFDGTALARDKPGILTTEFDAHDPEGALAKGVLVFVYQHATALLQGGQTYLLLDPANAQADTTLVRPVVGGVEEVCVMRRVGENF